MNYLDDIFKESYFPTIDEENISQLVPYPDPADEYRQFFNISKCVNILKKPWEYSKEDVIQCLKNNLFMLYGDVANNEQPEILDSYLFRPIPYLSEPGLEKLPIFKDVPKQLFLKKYMSAQDDTSKRQIISKYLTTYLNTLTKFEKDDVIRHIEYFLLELRQSYNDMFNLIFDEDNITPEPEFSLSYLNMELNNDFSIENIRYPPFGFRQSALHFAVPEEIIIDYQERKRSLFNFQVVMDKTNEMIEKLHEEMKELENHLEGLKRKKKLKKSEMKSATDNVLQIKDVYGKWIQSRADQRERVKELEDDFKQVKQYIEYAYPGFKDTEDDDELRKQAKKDITAQFEQLEFI